MSTHSDVCIIRCISSLRTFSFEHRTKRVEKNEGFAPEEAIEVVVAREEAIQVSPNKQTHKNKKKVTFITLERLLLGSVGLMSVLHYDIIPSSFILPAIEK